MSRLTVRVSLAAALAVGAALAWPALGQGGPESLLPPGFGSAPEPTAAPAPVAPATAPAAAPAAAPGAIGAAPEAGALPDGATPPTEAEVYKLPPPVSRPINTVGPLTPGHTGLAETAFDGADGRYLVGLMRRIDSRLASRWGTIVLRRALASRVPAAASVRPADWVAERALLLTRLGDVHAARMLVQAVPVDRYTPRLYAAAAQVALASADIEAFCPIADTGDALSDEPVWLLARGICAGLAGDSGLAADLIDRARDKKLANNIDLLLAERVAALGSGGQRAVNVEWAEANRLTAYRYGLATAGGLDIPDALMATAGQPVRAWQAAAPQLLLEKRIDAARTAAVLGIASSADLVDLLSAQAEETDPFAVSDTPAGHLRQAYIAEDMTERLTALRTLWTGATPDSLDYSGLILTARAAARIRPDGALADDAPMLIAAMLAAGLDKAAARWSGVVADMDDDEGDLAWALLAAGTPSGAVKIERSRVAGWSGGDDDPHRKQLLVAGLAGLGRLSRDAAAGLWDDSDGPFDASNRYLERIDRAAAANRVGEVALLAALGLQSGSWAGVPPLHLYHIVAALRRVGLEPEARMIVAEAITRA